MYDPLDRRIATTIDTTPGDSTDGETTHFVYNNEDVILEFVDADGAGPIAPVLSMRYLHGPGFDQVLAQEDYRTQDPSLRVLWLLPDHLGSTRQLVDNDGIVRKQIIYDAFGRVIGETNPTIRTRFLFTGREFDAETGLYYLRARYYDPGLGRFLGEDPVRFRMEDTNLYPYVRNDPVSRSDPSGMHYGFDNFLNYPFVRMVLSFILVSEDLGSYRGLSAEEVIAHRENFRSTFVFGNRYRESNTGSFVHEVGISEWLVMAAMGFICVGRAAHIIGQRRKRKNRMVIDDNPLDPFRE